MNYCNPRELFHGTVAVISPHMDDGELACAGTIARLPDKGRVHFIYATDGSRSPVVGKLWRHSPVSNIGEVRMNESRAALKMLGIPEENVHFLCLPEMHLSKYGKELKVSLDRLLERINPTQVLAPFRYDRHPDHLAVNRAATALAADHNNELELFEYFLYYQYRMLPKGDIRQYVQPEHLVEIDITGETALKREVLDCFTSQVTNYYPGQTFPVLSRELLEELSTGPEVFLRTNCAPEGDLVFASNRTWVRLAHTVEPVLKRGKDRVKSVLWSRIH